MTLTYFTLPGVYSIDLYIAAVSPKIRVSYIYEKRFRSSEVLTIGIDLLVVIDIFTVMN